MKHIVRYKNSRKFLALVKFDLILYQLILKKINNQCHLNLTLLKII